MGTLLREATALVYSRPSEAERLFRTVIDQRKAAGDYSADAFRMLAQFYDTWDNVAASAQVLDELVVASGQFGDSGTRLRALFDAAYQYQRLGRTDRADSLFRQIRPLLKSPAIPRALRREVASRVVIAQ